MLKMGKNFLGAALLVGLLWGGMKVALAEEQSGFVYLFKLYYDRGQLFADRDFKFKYDLIAENYAPEAVDTQSFFRGEIVAIGGKTEASFQFNPQLGKMTVKAPYFSDADLVNFYNPQGQKLFTISVKESSVCDNNGVCESAVGENQKNCSADCKLVYPAPVSSSAISPPLHLAGINWLGVGGGVAGLALILLAFWFWRKRKNKNVLPPPQIQ